MTFSNWQWRHKWKKEYCFYWSNKKDVGHSTKDYSHVTQRTKKIIVKWINWHGSCMQRQIHFLWIIDFIFQSYSCIFLELGTIRYEDVEKRKFCTTTTNDNSLQAHTSHITSHDRLSQDDKRVIKLFNHVHSRKWSLHTDDDVFI